MSSSSAHPLPPPGGPPEAGAPLTPEETTICRQWDLRWNLFDHAAGVPSWFFRELWDAVLQHIEKDKPGSASNRLDIWNE